MNVPINSNLYQALLVKLIMFTYSSMSSNEVKNYPTVWEVVGYIVEELDISLDDIGDRELDLIRVALGECIEMWMA